MILSNRINPQGYLEMGRVELMDEFRPYFSDHGMAQIEFAYAMSKYAHRPQMRDDGTRYFEHPKTVAWLIFERYKIYDWKTLVIALLHDVVEDSYILNEFRLRRNFGKTVARGVITLSKNTFSKKLLGEDDAPYYRRIIDIGSWQCLFVKLADRIHNLSTSDSLEAERRARKMQETVLFFPLIVQKLAQIVPTEYLSAVDNMRQDLADLASEWATEFNQPRPTQFDFELTAA